MGNIHPQKSQFKKTLQTMVKTLLKAPAMIVFETCYAAGNEQI